MERKKSTQPELTQTLNSLEYNSTLVTISSVVSEVHEAFGIPFFFGPLHTTASSSCCNKKPIDITASFWVASVYTGTQLEGGREGGREGGFY